MRTIQCSPVIKPFHTPTSFYACLPLVMTEKKLWDSPSCVSGMLKFASLSDTSVSDTNCIGASSLTQR